ncbi:amino acid transporter [Pullulanibacillus pueri]|uniref:Uncharacterized protein n=1 Tax=Pullulanibacillus pueri TaxID=1437324 RepID=A0A8J2ZTL8_9BACL|nr:hypothetical protein [Pullulanibacillus pueri]MBM7681039.1 amino acid transporter [Pullulanibacillus pueri]GGH76805.1 hypothetical protein GCM10007096_07760 [Pullulanibacillus pueri]
MDRFPFLYFICVLVGFALIQVPLGGTFLAGLDQVLHVIGVLAVIVFSIVLLYLGVLALFQKRFR